MNNKKSGMKLESNIDSIIAEFANFRELLIEFMKEQREFKTSAEKAICVSAIPQKRQHWRSLTKGWVAQRC